MHIYLLDNPVAGRGKAHAFLDGLTRALVAAGHRVTAYAGRSAQDVVEHVRGLAADDLDVLVVVGGDGTLRTVVGATDEAPPWPIGVIPVGTANLVAREMGMWPLEAPEALARRLAEGRAWPVDLLEMRRDGATERALAAVSVGIDGTLVHAVARARQSRLGGGYKKWLAPGLNAVRRFAFEPLEVQVDGGPVRTCASAFVQNTHNYGGLFTLSPDARLDSGLAEVVLLQARSARDLFRLVFAAGMGSFHRDRLVKIIRGRHVRLRATTPLDVQADGDPAGTTDLEITIRPRAVQLWRTS